MEPGALVWISTETGGFIGQVKLYNLWFDWHWLLIQIRTIIP